MSITIPTIYYITREGERYRADTRSNTILHRVKLGFGPIGIYETTLSRIGRPCLLYTSPSPRDKRQSRMPSSA